MAKKFLTSLDLSKCQLLNASIHNLAAAPSSPADGQIYFNTADAQMYFYNGTSWQSMSGDITDVDISAGTGISITQATAADGSYTATVSLAHLGIESLSDPGADRILFWDESADATGWLSLGTGLAFSDTTLTLSGILNSSLANDSVTVTAGDGLTDGGTVALGGSITLNVAAGTGIDVTADAVGLKGADALTDGFLPKWDDTAGELVDSVVYGDGTNIGINTTAPEADLHVVGKNNTVGTVLIETDSVGVAEQDQASLHFRVADNETAWKKFAIIAENTGDDNGRGALHFALDNVAAGDSATIADARMTILSDGTVGIGTSTPDSQYNLEVAGAVRVGGNLTVDGTITYINSNTVEIGDNILLLNSDATGPAAADAGLEVDRGDDTNVSFLWNETSDYWSTVDQAFHIGSIATETTMAGRTALIEEGGVVKKITNTLLVDDAVDITADSGSAINVTKTANEATYSIGIDAATTTQRGVVELATGEETAGLTVTNRAVTPDSLAALRYVASVPATSSGAIQIDHNLNSQWCIVQVIEAATGATIECDVTRVSPDAVLLEFCADHAADTFMVSIMKMDNNVVA